VCASQFFGKKVVEWAMPYPLALWAPILTTTKNTNTSDFPDWSENVGTWDHTLNPRVFTMNQKSADKILILYWVQFGSPCFGLTYTHDSCAGVWCTANAFVFNATFLTDPKHSLYSTNRNNFTVPYTAANKYDGSYDDQGLTSSWRPDAAATMGAVLSTVICVCLCICTRAPTHTHTHSNSSTTDSQAIGLQCVRVWMEACDSRMGLHSLIELTVEIRCQAFSFFSFKCDMP
jgi:hypothetical protein